MTNEARRKDDARADDRLHWTDDCSICDGTGTTFGKVCVCRVAAAAGSTTTDCPTCEGRGAFASGEGCDDCTGQGKIIVEDRRATLANALRRAALDLLEYNRTAGACLEIEGKPPLYILIGDASAIGKLLPEATSSVTPRSTDLSKRLRAFASNLGFAHSKIMIEAADEIERYYGGMLNWKATTEAKDGEFVLACQSQAAPVAWMDPSAGCVMDAFLWQEDPANPQYSQPVYLAAPIAQEGEPGAQAPSGEQVFELATPYFVWNATSWHKATQGTIGMPLLLEYTRAVIEKFAVPSSTDASDEA